MEAQESNPREWLGVIGAGAVAALVTALAMFSPAQGEPVRTNGARADSAGSHNPQPAPAERNGGAR